MQMSFVLPARFWDGGRENAVQAPSPMSESGVVLEASGGGMLARSTTMGVLWFGGFAGAKDVVRRKEELLSLVSSDEDWEPIPNAREPVLMQYNDPFTPPWARRNEVAVPLQRRAQN